MAHGDKPPRPSGTRSSRSGFTFTAERRLSPIFRSTYEELDKREEEIIKGRKRRKRL